MKYNQRIAILPRDLRNALQDRKEVAIKQYKETLKVNQICAKLVEAELKDCLPVTSLVQTLITQPHILDTCPTNESELLEVVMAEKFDPLDDRENLSVFNPRFIVNAYDSDELTDGDSVDDSN